MTPSFFCAPGPALEASATAGGAVAATGRHAASKAVGDLLRRGLQGLDSARAGRRDGDLSVQ